MAADLPKCYFIISLIWSLGLILVQSSKAKEDPWLCRWTPVQKNTKFREGLGAGTFHHLGYTPNMETCVDLCCKMPLCGVAFKSKDRCYGVECVSDDSCETVTTEPGDTAVEISHVRAGKRPANATDMNMAGQCRPSPIYKEVTLKGGIHAGTYKDVGGVSTMEECQKKCCEFPACDLAFTLASSCYLVGCADHKSCELQPAKKSSFHPSVSYVTRWNSEGVKHTVQLQEKSSVKHTCPPMKALDKVTLKGGLQVGDFTDVGKVNDLEQCYNICCQQENCDLAFMLAQNCFSVQCKDKKLCTTVPAQPSIFNPQIAYVTSRDKGPEMSPAPASEKANTLKKGQAPSECPKTKVINNVTLKGGVDAGEFHDNGQVDDMDKCRRICCEMTQCHLAFMLGKNCFSVKCHDVDACRAQSAKPSNFLPKISYVRKVGSNELLKPENKKNSLKSQIESVKEKFREQLRKPVQIVIGNLGDAPPKNATPKKPATEVKEDITTKLAKLGEDKGEEEKEGSLPGEAPAESSGDCKPGPIAHNVTLKGGRKAGEFKEITHVKDMQDCIAKCCEAKDKKCNLAFMLSKTCYAVTCKVKELCATIPAPASSFHPQVAMVREPIPAFSGLAKIDKLNQMPQPEEKTIDDKKEKVPVEKKPAESTQKPAEKSEEKAVDASKAKPVSKGEKSCSSKPPVKGKSLKGGKKAGKFRYFKNIKNINTCISKCCALNANCDVAYMEGGKCYTISCFKKGSCMAVDKQPNDQAPVIAYMDHFINKAEEGSDIENDQGIELSEESKPIGQKPADNGACSNVEIAHNVTLKGGTRAGVFKEVGRMVDMKKCVSSCCDRPECDVAYMLNGHCFAVQCADGSLCQATAEPAKAGDTVALAYMNKAALGEYKRDFFVLYIIAGSLAFVAITGGLIWMAFVFTKRQKLKSHKGRLLDEEEESVDDLVTRPSHTRYRTPMSRY
ncbi:uncharacterized protein LOC135690004 isoform X1 [Rhopilema esculentum]|uniref:uncharacterized protein LOC135690004 isoform X1 n=1 Tax=Rhopilema esculentum TaxID=499914 RepID=UPI0031E21420